MKKLRLLELFVLCFITTAVQSQTCQDSITANTPSSQFSVNGIEVTDSQTGLIWQKCSLGQSGSNCESGSIQSYTWSQALQAAQEQSQQTGLPWRLPNVNELRSIVEEKCVGPAINLSIFPNTPSSHYWSASPHAYYSNHAWYVAFYSGYSNGNDKDYSLYVRLVRSGQ